jgi:Zn-dependent M28 family amino/carboxypeptidase
VLANAQMLSQYRFTHTVKFLIYTKEEVGAYGSYNHARHVYEKGEHVIGVYNLDMVGYAETERGGRNIRFFETEQGSHLTDFCMTVSESNYDDIGLRIERVPNYPGSDHQAYLDYGYDAVFGAHYDGYPYGHSENNSFDKINFAYHTKVTHLFAATVAEHASMPATTYVSITHPREGYVHIVDRAVLPSSAKNWYTGLRGITVVVGQVTVAAETDGDIEKGDIRHRRPHVVLGL